MGGYKKEYSGNKEEFWDVKNIKSQGKKFQGRAECRTDEISQKIEQKKKDIQIEKKKKDRKEGRERGRKETKSGAHP